MFVQSRFLHVTRGFKTQIDAQEKRRQPFASLLARALRNLAASAFLSLDSLASLESHSRWTLSEYFKLLIDLMKFSPVNVASYEGRCRFRFWVKLASKDR